MIRRSWAVTRFVCRIARGYPLSSAWWVLQYELAEQRIVRARISGGAL